MEGAYSRMFHDMRRVLVRNIRQVVSRSDPSLPNPYRFGSDHPLTARFFEKITGTRAPVATRAYSREQLTRNRYLARLC